MRAAAIFGLGTSPANLEIFRKGSSTSWSEGLPAWASDADAVVVFGGDGTIHRHLGALVRLGLPVLVVPTGSGNDLARALKLHSVKESLKVWRNFESGKRQPQKIDLGIIRRSAPPHMDRYFCCVAGCGLDALVARRANQMPRWLRSHGGYVLAFMPALFRLPAYAMKLRRWEGSEQAEQLEDKKFRLTLLAAFANTQFYGDGMRIAPKADFSDGQLDVCRIRTMSPFKLFCMFPTVYFGQHLVSPEVQYWRATRVSVETETPLEIYADGEFVCQTPAEISIAAGVLQVIA